MASVGSSTVAMIKVFSMVMQPGRPSMQASAALAPGISQQAFKHAAGSRVAGVIPARVTPSTKIPIDGAGFSDKVRNSYRLSGGQSVSSEEYVFFVIGSLRHG